MMMMDKKKALETIIARRRDKDGKTSEAPMKAVEIKSEEGESDPRLKAVEDLMMAQNEKHPGKMMEAMAAFNDLHAMHSVKSSADSAS